MVLVVEGGSIGCSNVVIFGPFGESIGKHEYDRQYLLLKSIVLSI